MCLLHNSGILRNYVADAPASILAQIRSALLLGFRGRRKRWALVIYTICALFFAGNSYAGELGRCGVQSQILGYNAKSSLSTPAVNRVEIFRPSCDTERPFGGNVSISYLRGGLPEKISEGNFGLWTHYPFAICVPADFKLGVISSRRHERDFGFRIATISKCGGEEEKFVWIINSLIKRDVALQSDVRPIRNFHLIELKSVDKILQETDSYQSDSQKGETPSGSGRSFGKLFYGGFFLLIGAALMNIALKIVDPPFNPPLIVIVALVVGVIASIAIVQGMFLIFMGDWLYHVLNANSLHAL